MSQQDGRLQVIEGEPGWQDDKVASLIFSAGGREITIESITDRQLAQDMAGRVRAKVADLAG